MARIRYTKTYFNPPGQISQDLYKSIKIKLYDDPKLEIDPHLETFTQRFGGSFTTIAVCAGISIICGLLNNQATANYMGIIMGLFIMITLGTVIHVILEGPSYATYLKDKKDYFDRMKYVIKNSSDYKEFVKSFYTK